MWPRLVLVIGLTASACTTTRGAMKWSGVGLGMAVGGGTWHGIEKESQNGASFVGLGILYLGMGVLLLSLTSLVPLSIIEDRRRTAVRKAPPVWLPPH